MGIEIERKFLLANDNWRGKDEGHRYRQGYLNSEKGRTVRVRTVDETGFVTIKGPSNGGVRLEYEYPIPYQDALEMLDRLCLKPLIDKQRYRIDYQGFIWEVDEFYGENEGLVVAEIELQSPDQKFSFPDWIGQEVTGDIRYHNSTLCRNPYCLWKK